MAKFYTFDQNNSGGSFIHEPKRGIGYLVVVEAESAADANDRAEQIGIYFDGINAGVDCGCCGDRWDRAYVYGTDKPLQYGEPVTGGWDIPSYIHYLSGMIETRPETASA